MPPTTTNEFDFEKIRWIYYGLLLGMFTSSISQTIVSPAIPRIIADLGGVEYYSWLSTIVMLVMAVVTPVSGKLADMFGRRRFYILGLVIYMVGSVLSGAAQSFAFLVAARAIQGAGMGVLMPLSQTIIGDIIPPRQRGKYQGYMGAMMGASQVAGPLIGGAITDAANWRWLFYVNLPIGLAALFMIVRFLHIPELSTSRKIDYAGIATMTLGVTTALLGISMGGTQGWTNPLVIGLILVGVISLAIFVYVETKADEPIVPMHLFKNSVFTWSAVAAFFLSMILMVVLIYTPVYAQGVLGVSATASGMILIPMNVGLFSIGIVIGLLTTRTGRYKGFAIAGALVMVLAAILMLRLGVHSSVAELTIYTLVFGLGMGMAFQIYTLAVQNAVQRRDLGPATSSLQFFRNIAGTLGTAVAGTLMTTQLVAGVPAGVDPNAALNPSELAKLPPESVTVLHAALADAMHAVYMIAPWLAGIVLVATLMIKPLPLRDTLATNEDRGREVLDSTAMSNPDHDMVLFTPDDFHARSKERMMGAHLLLLAEYVSAPGNEILRAAVTEFGGGDLERGLQILRSSGTMLLSEDPAIIDEHEAFAVELSERGTRKEMLSDELTRRLHDISSRVAAQPTNKPTKPRIESAKGIDGGALNRALWMLDNALVADLATRRWLEDDER